MAAIAIGDCTTTFLGNSGPEKIYKIVTAATADDGDTIDLSSLFRDWVVGVCSGATDKTLLCTASVLGTTITIPGATDNEARTIIARGV